MVFSVYRISVLLLVVLLALEAGRFRDVIEYLSLLQWKSKRYLSNLC